MKQLIKGLLYKVAPRRTTAWMSARARAHSHRVLAEWGVPAVNRTLEAQLGNRVLSGPFRGLALTPAAQQEQVGPFLLGVYESELEGAWEVIFRSTYPQVIDVGAKFGYYAVGLALRYPSADVVAFDTDWWARRATSEMAIANDATNVRVLGFCSADWLDRNVKAGALIVSDCEGYEGVLFARVGQSLRTATLLIETHDALVPGVRARIEDGWSATHDIRAFSGGGPRAAPADLSFLSEQERGLAVEEVRPPGMVWLLLTPKPVNR